MPNKYVVYYEKSFLEPTRPQEDYFRNYQNIYIVADGITHDLQNGVYPNPSDSFNVAKITCDTFISELKNTKRELTDIQNSLEKVRKEVLAYNQKSDLYKNRENNGYTIGAVVFALIIVHEDRLIYAVLDDCFFSIFSEDMVDHPMLKSYVAKSSKILESNYDWGEPDGRKVWRKVLRNHVLKIDDEEYGYGAMDGRKGYERYIQYGEERLKKGDLICLYSDGFIKLINNQRFISEIKKSDLSEKTLEYIKSYCRKNKLDKEKTCCFVRIEN